MKKFILSIILLLTAITAFADPPCTPQPPYYTGSDKYDAQVKYTWYNTAFWGNSWPGRQAYCEDWWYIWQPAYYNPNSGYWINGGYVWLSDSSQQGRVVTITNFNEYGQVLLNYPQTWYDAELNRHIMQTANLLNSRGVWWKWI